MIISTLTASVFIGSGLTRYRLYEHGLLLDVLGLHLSEVGVIVQAVVHNVSDLGCSPVLNWTTGQI